MKRFLAGAAVLSFVFGVACTSSNTVTQGGQTNSTYDANYRQSTASSSQNYGTNQPGQQPAGDAPMTIMVLAAETGDMYPGEDYYIYAVVDNPTKRKVDYVWSVLDGDLSEVPESERGRLTTIVENEYKTAKPETAAPAQPAAGEPVAPGTPQQPAAGGQLQGPPTNAGLPGASQAPPTTDTGDQNIPPDQRAPNDPMAGLPQRAKDLLAKQQADPNSMTAEESAELKTLLAEYDAKVKAGRNASGAGQDTTKNNAPAQDDATKGGAQDNPEQSKDLVVGPQASAQTPALGRPRFFYEYRVIAGPDEQSTCDTQAEPQPAGEPNDVPAATDETAAEQQADEAAAGEVTPVAERDQLSAAANVGEDAVPEDAVLPAGANEGGEGNGGSSLRKEYQAWKDNSTPDRKRALGTYGGDTEEAVPTADDSYKQFSITTSEPFVRWEPLTPGKYTIYCKVVFKDDEIVKPLGLDVEVVLHEPVVNLNEDFSDVVREDDSIYARLDAENLPGFSKGLFTVTYDPDVLSFREAELGEFFDDATDATLYAAQPDKSEGKVLLAIDSNTELTDLSGDGTLVYLKFKAKQDVKEQSDTKLAMVMDTSARYILNHDGENILPVPITRLAFRTDTTMPPALPEYPREVTPGSEAGTPPAAAGQPAAGTAGPAVPATGAEQGQSGSQSPATPVTPATGEDQGGYQNSPAMQGGGSNQPANPDTGNQPVQTQPGVRGSSSQDTAAQDGAAAEKPKNEK